MRIEAYTQIQQIYQPQKAGKGHKSTNTGSADQVQISSFGKDIQIAKAAVQGSSDIREELTAPIKTKLQSGTYEVSNESFADKLLSKYKER